VRGCVGDIASDNVSTTEQIPLFSYVGDTPKRARDNGGSGAVKMRSAYDGV
jgi:hypothetical protein